MDGRQVNPEILCALLVARQIAETGAMATARKVMRADGAIDIAIVVASASVKPKITEVARKHNPPTRGGGAKKREIPEALYLPPPNFPKTLLSHQLSAWP